MNKSSKESLSLLLGFEAALVAKEVVESRRSGMVCLILVALDILLSVVSSISVG